MTILPGDYPGSWDGYIGQDLAKERLLDAVASALKRGAPMPHCLLTGPPGVGKTALGLLAAGDLGTNVRITTGAMKVDQFRILMARMARNDVLIMEEIHLLAKAGPGPEWLLHFLENGVLLGPWGSEPCKPVSVIATTTDPGAFKADILRRFDIYTLQEYTDDEAAAIALTFGEILLAPHGLPDMDNTTACAVATACRNHPSSIRKVVVRLRDRALSGRAGDVHADGYGAALATALLWSGVTADGLRAEELEYLRVMVHEFAGAPAGEEKLRTRLGLSRPELKAVEEFLLRRGLVQHLQQGRILTGSGVDRAILIAA
jgi:Holliday junction DNA helicase RuvB